MNSILRHTGFGREALSQPGYMEDFTQSTEAAVLGMVAYLATVQDENFTLSYLSLEETREGLVAYRWYQPNKPDARGLGPTGQAINSGNPPQTIGTYEAYAS